MLAVLVLSVLFYAFLLCAALVVLSWCLADFEIAVHERYRHTHRHHNGNGDRLRTA
jgi:hypothetical protein